MATAKQRPTFKEWTHKIATKKTKVKAYSEGQYVGLEPDLARDILYFLYRQDSDGESKQRSDVATFFVWADQSGVTEAEKTIELFHEWSRLTPDEQRLARRQTSNGTESAEVAAAESRPYLRGAKTFPESDGSLDEFRYPAQPMVGQKQNPASKVTSELPGSEKSGHANKRPSKGSSQPPGGSVGGSSTSKFGSFVHLNRQELGHQIVTQKQRQRLVEPEDQVRVEYVVKAKDSKVARDGIPQCSNTGISPHQDPGHDALALVHDVPNQELQFGPRHMPGDLASHSKSRSFQYGSMADLDAAEKAVVANGKDPAGTEKGRSMKSQGQNSKMPHKDVETIFDAMECDISIMSVLIFIVVFGVACFVFDLWE